MKFWDLKVEKKGNSFCDGSLIFTKDKYMCHLMKIVCLGQKIVYNRYGRDVIKNQVLLDRLLLLNFLFKILISEQND